MEVGEVRKRVQRAIDAARERALRRRERADAAEQAYERFLQEVATPVTRQVANALKAEGRPFTVFTPGRGLRLASDHRRDDFIEFALDTEAEHPHVLGRTSYTRGSRTIDTERAVKDGASPDTLTEDDVLEFLLRALEPLLDR